MINKRLLVWALRLLFYICLDAVTGVVIYAISVGEPGLTPGQLAIRILTAMGLASAIVGGPDIMLYWQESGRRIKAEEERDAAVQERDTAVRERDTAVANAAVAQKQLEEHQKQIDELRSQIDQLHSRRIPRRSRRRRLRNNSQ